MVPSQRNPLWGEEFNFLVEQLPVEVSNKTAASSVPQFSLHLNFEVRGQLKR
jgi:hypothetical protein